MSTYIERFISTENFEGFNEAIAKDVMEFILHEVSSFLYKIFEKY